MFVPYFNQHKIGGGGTCMNIQPCIKKKEGHLITNGKQQRYICINIYDGPNMLDGHIFCAKWKMLYNFNLIFWVQLLRYASNF